MTYRLLLLFFFFLLISPLHAYENESTIKVKIISKITRFITWDKVKSDVFIITVLNNPYGSLFDDVFKNKKIKKKEVEIKYINNIDDLSNSDILYIPSKDAKDIENIIQKSKRKNMLTISDVRGFAERKGVLQLYFVSQKIKLKINLASASEENLKISSSLLRIAKVIKE